MSGFGVPGLSMSGFGMSGLGVFGPAPALASSSFASIGFGLAAAITWGGSDFTGGIGARRSPALLVVASGQALTLLLLLLLCEFGHAPLLPLPQFWEATIGGFEGALALAAFYHALSLGAMGLTAALTGLLTALIPVLYGLWIEGLPTPFAAIGLLLGSIAIWLLAHAPGSTTPRKALILGTLSGIGFGLQLVLFKLASTSSPTESPNILGISSSVLWTMTAARIGGVLGLAIILLFAWPEASGHRVVSGFWKIGFLAGLLDTFGNFGYTLAAHSGRLDLAATLSCLYPGFTILLASFVLKERPSRRQSLGMFAALLAVVFLSL